MPWAACDDEVHRVAIDFDLPFLASDLAFGNPRL
jgi:hypothetical protein